MAVGIMKSKNGIYKSNNLKPTEPTATYRDESEDNLKKIRIDVNI